MRNYMFMRKVWDYACACLSKLTLVKGQRVQPVESMDLNIVKCVVYKFILLLHLKTYEIILAHLIRDFRPFGPFSFGCWVKQADGVEEKRGEE